MQVLVGLFIKGNEADHTLGKSIHPFDVVSWAKEGKDEDLEGTLKLIVEVADVKMQELVGTPIPTTNIASQPLKAIPRFGWLDSCFTMAQYGFFSASHNVS